MTTTKNCLPIELHVLSLGSSFNIEGTFNAAIMMEDQDAKISEIVYIELEELKDFLSSNGFDFGEESEAEKEKFIFYLSEDSEEGKQGIEFVNSDHELMQFLSEFIESDYNESSIKIKQ